MNFLKQYHQPTYKKRPNPIKLRRNHIDLLILLASGRTLKEIAFILNKKVNNIKKRTQYLYKKFNVSKRKDLIKKAVEYEFISARHIKPLFRKRFVKIEKTYDEKFNIVEPLTLEEISFLYLKISNKTHIEICKILNLYAPYIIQYIQKSIVYKLNAKNIINAIYIARNLKII